MLALVAAPSLLTIMIGSNQLIHRDSAAPRELGMDQCLFQSPVDRTVLITRKSFSFDSFINLQTDCYTEINRLAQLTRHHPTCTEGPSLRRLRSGLTTKFELPRKPDFGNNDFR